MTLIYFINNIIECQRTPTLRIYMKFLANTQTPINYTLTLRDPNENSIDYKGIINGPTIIKPDCTPFIESYNWRNSTYIKINYTCTLDNKTTITGSFPLIHPKCNRELQISIYKHTNGKIQELSALATVGCPILDFNVPIVCPDISIYINTPIEKIQTANTSLNILYPNPIQNNMDIYRTITAEIIEIGKYSFINNNNELPECLLVNAINKTNNMHIVVIQENGFRYHYEGNILRFLLLCCGGIKEEDLFIEFLEEFDKNIYVVY